MKERNIQLDILKVMACFAVVVIHVTGIITFNMWAKYSISHTLYYISGFAVPVFFMVNGFFLLNKSSVSYSYTIKKMLNILLVIFSWSIVLLLFNLIKTKRMINPFYISLNSLIQREYFWQFWFFGALIIIYAVLPVIHKFFINNKTAVLLTAIFILACLTIDCISIYRSVHKEPIVQIQVIQTYRLWTWFAYYLLGGLLGKREIMGLILNKISNKVNLLIFVLTSIIISVYQFKMAHEYYRAVSIEFFYDNIFTFIWILSLFTLIFRQKLKLNKGTGKILGSISDKIMGIYIVHVTVINIALSYYRFTALVPNLLLILIVAFVSFIVTLMISKIPVVNKLVRI